MNAPQTPLSAAAAAAIPAGFKPLKFMGFMAVNGPLYGYLHAEDGLPVMGFRVEERHCNPMMVCHGGMLMTFADMLLGFTCSVAAGGRKFMPTVNLAGDYVGPAKLGSWVEGRGRLLRQTRNLGFADCLITADGAPCLRASGIMKIPAQESREADVLSLFG
ncbi:MAG TPA: PaaI family thioesterase [Ferrovibrio sp.]|jgi:uncharacterized protein (TIGR00369 family)|uniref:PaaI family thioesterase n=1 Tax=Ferrovibrio sp. TaxID=1917215 RepID=UPI002ED4CB30